MRTAIDGMPVFDANFQAVTPTAARTPTTFVESSANTATVTLSGTKWSWSREAPAKPVLGAAGTDAATTQVLANQLRQALLDLALAQAG